MTPHLKLAKDPSRFERVIVCGAPERAALIAERLEGRELVAQNREYHSYLGKHAGQNVLVTSHGVGAPGATICFQELIQIGARRIIRIGTAGALQDDLGIGDLVVPTAAVRKDGVSVQMIPLNFPAVPDFSLASEMLQQCRKQGVMARAGTIVTADLFYPELVDGELELYSKAGCVAVEMECSALFVTGSLRRVQTAAIVALDGNPLKWKEGNYAPTSDAMAKAVERAIGVALAAVTS